jgi:hypothetical protein
MLFPRHPKPVSRREVAAMIVSQRQRELVGPGHVIVLGPDGAAEARHAPEPARAGIAEAAPLPAP